MMSNGVYKVKLRSCSGYSGSTASKEKQFVYFLDIPSIYRKLSIYQAFDDTSNSAESYSHRFDTNSLPANKYRIWPITSYPSIVCDSIGCLLSIAEPKTHPLSPTYLQPAPPSSLSWDLDDTEPVSQPGCQK